MSEETFENNRAPRWTLIKENAARDYFEQIGYMIIEYETGYAWSQWEDADFYLEPRSGFIKKLIGLGLECVPELIRVLLKKAMRMERQNYLKAKTYERTTARRGHAYGYKSKTVKNRIGELNFDIPEVGEGSF